MRDKCRYTVANHKYTELGFTLSTEARRKKKKMASPCIKQDLGHVDHFPEEKVVKSKKGN